MRPSPAFRVFLYGFGIVLALALAAEALAGHPPKSQPPPVKYPPASTASADSAALAAARAASAAGAVAGANAEGGDGGAADATSVAEGGSGIGTVEGDSTRVASWGVALSVPAATAAPAVPGRCLEHSRGWAGGWGAAARSGGTKLQALCEERLHCLSIADLYARVGAFQAMADQLATCGGVKVTMPPAPPPAAPAASSPPINAVPREEFEAAVRRLEERQDAIFRRGVTK